MAQREIFMRNGSYLICEVLIEQEQDKPFEERTMMCRTPDGREFIAVPDMSSLGEELPKEMARVRDEVVPAYSHPALNGAGAFALMMMRRDLDAAAKAMAEGDVVEMLRAYEALKCYDT
jgi:hypothetical protein